MNRILLPLTLLTLTACAGAPDATDSFASTYPEPTEVVSAPPVAVEMEVVSSVPELLEVEVAAAPAEALAVDETVATPSPARYELRRGETLAHFARWSGQPVEDVAASSHLDLDGTYAVGTELALHLSDEERSVVEARRDAHHQLRARNYLSSRGSTRTEFYSVRTGDNAWRIAREQLGMPVWLLESLNPSADLETLRPGQELLVPVFQDIVVEAEAALPVDSARIDPSTTSE